MINELMDEHDEPLHWYQRLGIAMFVIGMVSILVFMPHQPDPSKDERMHHLCEGVSNKSLSVLQVRECERWLDTKGK